MILAVDPIAVFATNFRELPEAIAKPEFLKAIRHARPLLHSPEYVWTAWRADTLSGLERETVDRALAERLGGDPEYARLASLGFAYQAAKTAGSVETRIQVLQVQHDDDELAALDEFWRVAAWARSRHCTIVTYGGRHWGLPFLLRRSLLRGQTPRLSLPVGRARLDVHFDVDDVLSNWDRSRSRPLDLAARQYDIDGPWRDRDSADVPTADVIRHSLAAGQPDRAHRLALARLHAILALYHRLSEPYLAATGA